MSDDPPVGARFVSQKDLEAARAKRDADWKAAYERIGQQPPKKEEAYDGRSLFERLKENRDKKQEEFEESLKLKNQFRTLNAEEAKYLRSLNDDEEKAERQKQQEISEQLDGYKKAVQDRRSNSSAPVPEPRPAVVTSTPKLKPKKKTIAGVVVKKKDTKEAAKEGKRPSDAPEVSKKKRKTEPDGE